MVALPFQDSTTASEPQRNMNSACLRDSLLMLTRSSTVMFTTMGLPENACVLPGECNRGWARMGADNGDMDARPVFNAMRYLDTRKTDLIQSSIPPISLPIRAQPQPLDLHGFREGGSLLTSALSSITSGEGGSISTFVALAE